MSAATQQEMAADFAVKRNAWSETRVTREPIAPLRDGEVLFRVDRFALTANNITYALTGDMLGYWRFFPAPDPWGRIPVMGFAEVGHSAHPQVAVGERVFGFFPMSTHLRIEAGEVHPASFLDVSAHRRDTAFAYRQYTRCAQDRLYAPGDEDALMLLRGLFLTSFLVDDFIAEHAGFDAGSFVLSSASSKTAIALAYLLSRRARGRVVGLTSPRNAEFVEGLGCYDVVLPYDGVAALAADDAAVFVDHAGDAGVVAAVHRHFGDNLRHSAIIGATHWDRGGSATGLPGPAPAFFFAPSQLEKRRAEWGGAAFDERLAEAWRGFLSFVRGWLRVVRGNGEAAVEAAYRAVLEGRARPDEGHVLSLWERAD